jgi:hypothetical protein
MEKVGAGEVAEQTLQKLIGLHVQKYERYLTQVAPYGVREFEVTIETVSDHKEGHFQFESLRGDRMNGLR